MASLFLDTSGSVTFGILDEELNWLSYKSFNDVKASRALHGLIFEALKAEGLFPSDLKTLFYVCGPGSYTGVRVAQGFAEVLELQGVKTFSCLHFEVPQILGVAKGMFISRAFKKEVFLYSWSENGSFHRRLAPEEQGLEEASSRQSEGVKVYTSESEVFEHFLSTFECIEQRPKELFSAMENKRMKSKVFYYRNIEEEFSRGK